MGSEAPVLVLCNGASPPDKPQADQRVLALDYLEREGNTTNVRIGLPCLVRDVYHLPDRVLDLLELAAFIYCADRMRGRGSKDAVEYQAWARSFHFIVKVRDHAFWASGEVADCLSQTLCFMTGDREYSFSFESGHSTPATSLFDDEKFMADNNRELTVMLFSGGLDSLAGVLSRLQETEDKLCLVSHQSQPGTVRTQQKLVEKLSKLYLGRIFHYRFKCTLKGKRAVEETQRSRAFLYTSIAFAVAQAFSQNSFIVYENGITGLNFSRRSDLVRARASRTTHPKTIHSMNELFTLISERNTSIQLPFLWNTKTDVMALLKAGPHSHLIPSSVSCSKTFQNLGQATHCGGCSQCIDRRFAAYASKTNDIDESGIYAHDIISTAISEREIKTTAVDYVRQAKNFSTWNEEHLFMELSTELAEIVDYLPGDGDEFDKLKSISELCKRHGDQVALAMKRMRDAHDDLYSDLDSESLLGLISSRDYLKDPVARLVDRICELIKPTIGRMFSGNPPEHESDLNAKISSLLASHEVNLRREHPVVSFAGGHTIPDHGSENSDLLVECKYLRGATSPSKASESMAADLTKYPQDQHILFVVYDPQRAVRDDAEFKGSFESRGRCTVLVVR